MELAKLGYGNIQGQGNRLKLVRNQTVDTVDVTVDKTADSSSEPETIDIKQFQDLEQRTVDTVDIGADVGDCDLSSQPGGVLTSSLSEQQYQHISSFPSTLELSSPLTADEMSAELSAVGNGAALPVNPGGSYQDDAGEKPATMQQLANRILLCQTWAAVVETVNRDGDKLKKAAAEMMTSEQRQGLTTLLAAHLCENPADLNQLKWVPIKLRDRALQRLTFTILRIGGLANPVDACLEKISGCKFISVEHLRTRGEAWIFQTSDGVRLPMFGVDAVCAIAKA